MNGSLYFSSAFLALAFAAPAMAQEYRFSAPYLESVFGSKTTLLRCTDDQIITAADAERRIQWAYSCKLLDPALFDDEFRKTYNRRTKTWEPLPAGQLRYPIFAHIDAAGTYPVWHPDYNQGCAMPSDVQFYDICLNGCFRGDQRVAFDDGFVSLEKAVADSQSRALLTLDGTRATLEEPVYTKQDVGYFVRSAEPAHETLITLTTAQGALTVTRNHPLVDAEGFIALADQMNVGDALVRSNGQLDPILQKTYEDYFGIVYNVAPVSEEIADNVIVAEGFLNGSHRFQDGGLADFRGVVVKRRVDLHLDR